VSRKGSYQFSSTIIGSTQYATSQACHQIVVYVKKIKFGSKSAFLHFSLFFYFSGDMQTDLLPFPVDNFEFPAVNETRNPRFDSLSAAAWPNDDAGFLSRAGIPPHPDMKLDTDGYPLEPNGSGHWRFITNDPSSNVWKSYSNWCWHTISSPKTPYGKFISKKCQGLLICTGEKGNAPCGATMRPKTYKDPMIGKTLQCVRCESNSFRHIECPAKIRFDIQILGDFFLICVTLHHPCKTSWSASQSH
jgi:hypothetical protein